MYLPYIEEKEVKEKKSPFQKRPTGRQTKYWGVYMFQLRKSDSSGDMWL